jgi:peptidoglycan/LPS O-acetylase OafA/YrhL
MTRERNALADGLRGMAALAVATLHAGFTLKMQIATGGYLAVDFFFILSGLVIAQAYDKRLANRMTAFRFLKIRAIRLYPLFALGCLLGIVKSVSQIALHDSHAMAPGQLALATSLNLLMLPIPLSSPALFPINSPAWSLFCELAINVAYALILVKLRSRWLVAIATAGAGVMIFALVTGEDGLNVGYNRATLAFGLARVSYGFCLGMLIARLARDMNRRPRWLALAMPLVMLAFLTIPVSNGSALVRDALFAFLVAPAIIWAVARMDVPERFRRPFVLLGDLSYPLYAVHYPILLAVSYVGLRMHLPKPAILVSVIGIVSIAAYAAERWLDRPVRHWLSSRFGLHESAAPQVIGKDFGHSDLSKPPAPTVSCATDQQSSRAFGS